MGHYKPLSAVDRAFILDNYPKMSKSSIARALGRSPSTVTNVLRESADGEAVSGSAGEPGTAPEPQTAVERLRELRGMLLQAMKLAQPREMAALAREYRATVESVERMEGACADEDADGLDALAESIAKRMRA